MPPAAQVDSPVGHTHVPLAQPPPAAHALPQLPQSVALVDVSTHRPSQLVSPVSQPAVQVPFTHWLPGPHRLPQPPHADRTTP